ncbi:MAG: c-type cytochrome [Deltaproteobacteria bacterium]|nr:c-type cytochrome [Deltaproteobacteria bacterium]
MSAEETRPSAQSGAHGEAPDYDGIVEHDNHLPRWWLMTLFGAIIFSVGYWLYYHKLEGRPQRAELEADEKALVEARDKAIASRVNDESLLAARADAAAMGRGQDLYKTTCAACHGEKGEGKIGPNLTDASWIHGGKPSQIFMTVTRGVPEKGMVAWGPSLGAAKVQDVVVYLLSIKNTQVVGKAPEGTPEP